MIGSVMIFVDSFGQREGCYSIDKYYRASEYTKKYGTTSEMNILFIYLVEKRGMSNCN